MNFTNRFLNNGCAPLCVSIGGSRSSGSSSTKYTERPLTGAELDLIRESTEAGRANREIAKNAEARSEEQYARHKDVYQKAENEYISKVNTTEFGTPDKRMEEMLRAGARQASESGRASAQRGADRENARRGLSANSGVSVASSLAIGNKAQEINAQGQNEALFKAIQYGDQLKQNKLGNLGSIVGMGSQSFGGASQYQSNAMSGNNSAGQMANQTFSSWDKRFQQSSTAQNSAGSMKFSVFGG